MRRLSAVAVVLSLAVLSLELTACGEGSSVTGPGSPQEPAATPTPDPGPPNIVLVVADDMGWGDLSSYGNTQIRTPRIDSLATEGLRFTQAYTPAAICAASRAALLTGLTPGHNRVPWNPPRLIDEDTPFVSQVLQKLGYSTGMVGKWHVDWYTPEERGFNWAKWTFAGIHSPNWNYASYYTHLAVEWLESQRGSKRPFFLYVCHHDPHTPLAAPPDFAGRSPAGLYGDTVEWLDAQVGVLLDGLRAMELEQNTLVVFVSDNGPPKGIGFRGPLSGDKGSCLEGGVRVPMLVRWPARIRGNRVVQTPISTLDWFPTFVTLARGGQLLPDHHLDGLDLTALLSGQADVLTGLGIGGGRELLFWGPKGTCGLRSGRMKYLRAGWWHPHPQLLDLEADVGETHNLIREQPELAEQLALRLEDLESR